MSDKNKSGTVYVVSTPIGNMDDLSKRAIDCLEAVDIVACEDTRRTGLLLSRLGFKKHLISYNDVNAVKRVPVLLEYLNNGKNVALAHLVSVILLTVLSAPLWILVSS